MPITAAGDLNKLFTALVRSTIYSRHHRRLNETSYKTTAPSSKWKLNHKRKPDWHIEWGFPNKHTVLRWRSTQLDCIVCWNPLKGPGFGSKRHGFRGWHDLRIESIEVQKYTSQNDQEIPSWIVAPLCSCHGDLEATRPARNRRKKKPGRHVIYCAE